MAAKVTMACSSWGQGVGDYLWGTRTEAVHTPLPMAAGVTREGCIPPQFPMWLYRSKPPQGQGEDERLLQHLPIFWLPCPPPYPRYPESAGSDISWPAACDLVEFSFHLHIPVNGQRCWLSMTDTLHFSPQ